MPNREIEISTGTRKVAKMSERDTLPVNLMPNQPKIKDLKAGESGYVTPWTMLLDRDGYCYLNPHTRIDLKPGGTVSLLVGKDTLGRYYAEASNAYRITFGYGYEWDITDGIPDNAIPVEKVY